MHVIDWSRLCFFDEEAASGAAVDWRFGMPGGDVDFDADELRTNDRAFVAVTKHIPSDQVVPAGGLKTRAKHTNSDNLFSRRLCFPRQLYHVASGENQARLVGLSRLGLTRASLRTT